MKGFLRFIGALITVFTAVLGAMAVFDKMSNKNRIQEGYLKCDIPETKEE